MFASKQPPTLSACWITVPSWVKERLTLLGEHDQRDASRTHLTLSAKDQTSNLFIAEAFRRSRSSFQYYLDWTTRTWETGDWLRCTFNPALRSDQFWRARFLVLSLWISIRRTRHQVEHGHKQNVFERNRNCLRNAETLWTQRHITMALQLDTAHRLKSQAQTLNSRGHRKRNDWVAEENFEQLI